MAYANENIDHHLIFNLKSSFWLGIGLAEQSKFPTIIGGRAVYNPNSEAESACNTNTF